MYRRRITFHFSLRKQNDRKNIWTMNMYICFPDNANGIHRNIVESVLPAKKKKKILVTGLMEHGVFLHPQDRLTVDLICRCPQS